jgi:hypothetical protein
VTTTLVLGMLCFGVAHYWTTVAETSLRNKRPVAFFLSVVNSMVLTVIAVAILCGWEVTK